MVLARRRGCLSCPKCPHGLWGPFSFLFNVHRALSPEVQRQWREVSVDVKSEWSYTSRSCCVAIHTFTFYPILTLKRNLQQPYLSSLARSLYSTHKSHFKAAQSGLTTSVLYPPTEPRCSSDLFFRHVSVFPCPSQQVSYFTRILR